MKGMSLCFLSAVAIVSGSCMSACGGGGIASSGSIGGSKPQTGPNGILNGASLTAATTHWVAAGCHVQVELTSDKGSYTVVVDKTGTTSAGTGNWTIGADPTSVGISSSGGGLGGFYWVSYLQGITGSIASGSFTAGVSVTSGSTSQVLGTCSFILTQGKLSK